MTPLAAVADDPGDHRLTWTHRYHGHAHVLTLIGDLDADAAARLRAELQALLRTRSEGASTVIVIDLREVRDLPPAALELLLDTDQNPRLDVRVVAAPHPALSTLQSHRRAGPLPLFHTPEAALEPELTELQHLRREVDQRRQQLAGQPAIEQAKGILMHNLGLTPDESLALLRRISQDTNLKVRAIADQLVVALTGHVTPQAAERVATVIEELRQQARTVH